MIYGRDSIPRLIAGRVYAGHVLILERVRLGALPAGLTGAIARSRRAVRAAPVV
jgi:hypothetical protein